MPRIIGRKIDLHPVILILSLLIGAKLYGILGMLFAVPVAAVYRVLYKELCTALTRQWKKQLPHSLTKAAENKITVLTDRIFIFNLIFTPQAKVFAVGVE